MSNSVVAFNPGQLPTFARNRESKGMLSKALAGGGGGGYPRRISIKGGVFRLIADGKEIAQIDDRYLDVVIVNAAPSVSRSFYAKKYSENDNAGPSCWSENGEKPDASVSQPQSNACATCPQNVKGSGDGETRACRFSQRIAMVLANDVQGDILQMVVPAKSLFGKEEDGNFPLQAYARWLSAQNVEPNEVITRMRFDTRAESPKLFFKAMRWLSDDEFEVVSGQSESENAKKAVEAPKYASGGDVTTPKAPALAPPPQKEEPAAAADDEEDEAPPPAPAVTGKRGRKPKAEAAEPEAPVAEPTVRKTPEAPTVKSKSVAALVADWDTDD